MTNARSLANFATGIGTEGAVLTVDNTNNRIGIATTNPQNDLQVGLGITMEGDTGQVTFVGIVTAEGFRNSDGSVVGAASTDNIITGTAATFTSDVNIADSIIHVGDTNTKIRFPAADTFTVETAGSERLRITSGGAVGINTTTPVAPLEIQGVGGTNDANIQFTRHGTPSNDSVVGQLSFRIGTDSVAGISALRESAMDDAYLAFFTQPTSGSFGERLRITSTGKVSIGNESSPLGTLHVKEGDSGVTSADTHQDTLFLENNDNAGLTIATPNTNTGYLTFADPEDSNIGQIIYRHSDNSMSMFVNTAERLRITSTGLVGVGTVGPTHSLHVYDTTDNSAQRNDVQAYTGGITIQNQAEVLDAFAALRFNFHGDDSFYLKARRIANNNGEFEIGQNYSSTSTDNIAIKIDNSRNVGIGTTTPTAKLHVVGDARITGIVTFGTGSITIDGDGGTINGLGYPTAGPITNRNMIVNGAFQIDQRNQGNSITCSSGETKYAADRAAFINLGTGELVLTLQQVTDAPAGFRYSNKATVTTAESSGGTPAANDRASMQIRLEGNTVESLALGTSDAKDFVVSFYVKSSLTGNFGVAFVGTNRSYPVLYNISSADTWERKVIKVPGPTDGTWGTGNSLGFALKFGLYTGVDRDGPDQGTAGTGTWQTNATPQGVENQVQIGGTLNATWQITGVQMELGSQATPFEHRSFADELDRCYRYYQNSFGLGNVPGTSTSDDDALITTSWTDGNAPFPQFARPMRATPSVTLRPRGSTTTGQVSNGGTGKNANAQQSNEKNVGYLQITGGTDGQYNAFSYELQSEL